jgi:hypothetical protein
MFRTIKEKIFNSQRTLAMLLIIQSVLDYFKFFGIKNITRALLFYEISTSFDHRLFSAWSGQAHRLPKVASRIKF